MIGKYVAKIVDYGLNKTQGGKPQAVVQFGFEHDGQAKTFTWYGTLAPDNDGKRKGIEITLKALYAMGMTMQTVGRLSTDFFEGPKTGILDMTKDLSIELQEEPSQNDPGKMQTRVQWVNDPNDTYVIKKLAASDAVQVMSGLNFEGDFHKIAQEKAGKQGGQTQGQTNQGQTQGQNQNYNQNQNQNYNQNQNQNQQQNFNNGNQNQNYNNGNQNQNYNNGNQNQGQNSNQNQGNNGQQTNQGGNGFKAPF